MIKQFSDNDVYYNDDNVLLYHGHVLNVLKTFPDCSVHCVVTSPPYWGLRSYLEQGHPDKSLEIGNESCLEEYIDKLVDIFEQVKRILRDDGALWLNLGDCYKAKQLLGIPWKVAFALQKKGWCLRSDCIWAKPNPMPESVKDRPTASHEYVFLLSKSKQYYYDNSGYKEENTEGSKKRFGKSAVISIDNRKYAGMDGESLASAGSKMPCWFDGGKVMRTVWNIPTEGCKEAHFATFPQHLVERCVKVGTSEKGCCPDCQTPYKRIVGRERRPTRPGLANVLDDTGKANRDVLRHVTKIVTTGWEPGCACGSVKERHKCVVLDPFMGTGRTGIVALKNNRNFIGIDLVEDYCAMVKKNIKTESRRMKYRFDCV